VTAWLTEADIWTSIQHAYFVLDSRPSQRAQRRTREPPRFWVLIEIKIDQIAQKSGDISQKRLDFSYFLLGAFV
jgi:hypothetical protein